MKSGMTRLGLFAAASACAMAAPAFGQTNLYWGETHLHTNASVDAYATGELFIDPDQAYRYAKGAPVLHPRLQTKVQIARPLDFMVVADHAERLRLQVNFIDSIPPLTGVPGFAEAREYVVGNPRAGMGPQQWLTPELQEAIFSNEVRQYSWEQQVDAAERHNQPGVFTTFAGWEWTRNPGGNLHRVVFTPDGPDVTKQFIPFSSDEGPEPKDLWNWLDETSASTGARFIAIPHNSNLSNGRMFGMVDSEGLPIDVEYARARARWEPVMEITQVKGTSEVHPALSPNDEFADFEIHMELLIGGVAEPDEADYGRYALLRGLFFEQELGINPYKYGFIGASDSHLGLTDYQENDFGGKTTANALPAERLETDPDVGFFHPWEMSASGLAGVWAEENTRESIAAAFKRREVYGTSGPRMAVRMFGGFGFTEADAASADIVAAGYAGGVPMGGDLAGAPDGAAPTLLIHAARDAEGANLDRVQVVKGWIDADGEQQEKVFDALWSGDREIGADGRLPAVGNTVDLDTALYENTIGAPQLVGVWTDPEFDPGLRAFYYLRVLEIPTPRQSLYDAVALRVDPEVTTMPTSIQERAWSSPIWYTP